MPLSLKSVAGGGDFKPSFFSGTQQIASGVSGDILTLNAPVGKRVVRITALIVGASGDQDGVSVICDGEAVVDALTLTPQSPTPAGGAGGAGRFAVGNAVTMTSSTAGGGSGVLEYVEGEQIIVNKSGGNTTQTINYSYAYGD